MSATIPGDRATSQVLRAYRSENSAVDWDAVVRQAFLEGCVQQGVRAALAAQALAERHDPKAERSLRDAADDAGRRAALAWLTIETCLEQYGELAALALERCIEEASLQIRRRSSAPSSAALSTGQLDDRDDSALSIVERGRERLARFWRSSDTSAA
jgi:hypothetical protein